MPSLSQRKELIKELEAQADPVRATFVQGYFKTGPGEYGAGDIFIGLTVPYTRSVAKNFQDLSFEDLEWFLAHKIHEYRLVALIILVNKFKKADEKLQKKTFTFYIKNKKGINNWDLVDTSAQDIVGGFLFSRQRDLLYKLIKSKRIWDRRIAIVATHFFIVNRDFADTFSLCEEIIYSFKDKEDLMHKACGWMLREVGNRDKKSLVVFLQKHAASMPRTMLRYSIERFTPEEKTYYLTLPRIKNV